MAIDDQATAFINGLSRHAPWLDAFMIAVTTYGVAIVLATVAVRWWWIGSGSKMRERYLALLCGASAALGLAVNQGILLMVHRVRPYDVGLTHLIVPPSVDPSFPSDHATFTFALAVALLGAGARRGWLFLIAAILISFSRLYVGTHYLSDVLGGALTGAVAAVVCLLAIGENSRLTRTASKIL